MEQQIESRPVRVGTTSNFRAALLVAMLCAGVGGPSVQTAKAAVAPLPQSSVVERAAGLPRSGNAVLPSHAVGEVRDAEQVLTTPAVIGPQESEMRSRVLPVPFLVAPRGCGTSCTSPAAAAQPTNLGPLQPYNESPVLVAPTCGSKCERSGQMPPLPEPILVAPTACNAGCGIRAELRHERNEAPSGPAA